MTFATENPKVDAYMRNLAVACPTCTAPNGARCIARGRYMTGRVHAARSKAAEAQREADRLFKFVITEGTTRPLNDPNPEITALREFVRVTKPLKPIIELHVKHGTRHLAYSKAILKALATAEESLKIIDEVIAKYEVIQ